MSKIQDLSSYLEVLQQAGQLAHIERPVDMQYELADVAAALERQQGPAPLFMDVKQSPWPVFSSSVANQARAALALDCKKTEVVEALGKALDPANGLDPIRQDDAPWKKHVFKDADVDLHRLPIPTHAVGDGGPFITAGVVISKDPISGRGNLSYNRMQVKGPRTMGFNINEWRHVRDFLDIQEDKNEPLQIAVAIGLDPAIMIAAGARYDDDELKIAGAIRGHGIPVCQGVTTALDIPVGTEIVIEGYLAPHERKGEGPLAEFHGFTGELWESPVLHVTSIAHRSEPIFQTIIPGWNEHVYLGNVLPREPLLLQHARHVSKNVKGLHIPPYGSGFTAIATVEKSNPGEPKNVALGIFTAHMNIKWCIVVDPDVDIYDPADVMWALTSRVDWSKDIFLIPGAQGHEMDPTADNRGIHTKIGVDATTDQGLRDYGDRVRYRPVDLNNYI